MTINELITALEKLKEKDRVVILEDLGGGWANIDKVKEQTSTISLTCKKHPIFCQ